MCSVCGCDSWRRSAQSFKLPEDPERRLEWVMFIAEVNKQRFKESSWTDIAVCSEHFAGECFVNSGAVQLKPGAVPSLCVSSGPDNPVRSPGCAILTLQGDTTGGLSSLLIFHDDVMFESSKATFTLQLIIDDITPIDQPEWCLGSNHGNGNRYYRTEPVDNTEAVGQCDPLKAGDRSNSSSEESRPTSTSSQKSPVPIGASSVCSLMQPKDANTYLFKEKAALLKTEGKFLVNEKRLLRLFSRRCPSCGGKLEMLKVTRGVVVIVTQQCLQCDYTHQAKSQVHGSVPAAEDGHLREGVDVTAEAAPGDETSSSISEVPEVVAVIDEENDSVDESRESSDPGDASSDEDWRPVQGVFPVKLFHVQPNQKSEVEHNYNDYYSALTPQYSQLCTECGRFFDRRRPHTCEHKMKPYSCNICGKRCVNEVALNFHSRIHDENYEFCCKYCHVTFKLKADKITHEQLHVTQGKPYKCPDCSETFATNKERRLHLEDHRGSLELKCRFCGIEFFRALSIQRHLLVHTGEKPYKCSVCQRGFNQASHLKSHMRLHTGERPYKCQHCDKCFNHNVSLKSHVQRCHASSAGPEEKRDITDKSESDNDGAQSDGNQSGTDSELETEEEEQDIDDEVQMERMYRPKRKRKSTGRPIGRPKRSESGKVVVEDQAECLGSSTGTSKSQERKKECTDEEGVGEPSDSNSSLDSIEEQRPKKTKNTASRRNNGKSVGKCRGRRRK
ncbi:uncharacterized protein [Leuresthes tenuis]|uniref:uncharacterized protein n=1 Tax=Leuresthes tenuis TaxID=355514 RepID=UPI003B501A26